MNLNSKLFDRIRIKSRAPHEEPRVQTPRCSWEGCDRDGIYRAPKGHRAVGEYHSFCLEHVRHYNTAFNFFAGMSTDQVEEHLSRSAQTDGRPSWGMGAKSDYRGPRAPLGGHYSFAAGFSSLAAFSGRSTNSRNATSAASPWR